MRYMILCPLKQNSDEPRKALRLKHLEYIKTNTEKIIFGGPTIAEDGTPKMMVLVVEVSDPAQAQSFIDAEPYYSSGEVFDWVEIYPWVQVMPELHPNALASEIEKEKTK
ncbi:YciI family protein [Kovacikia minuta CCNUW1]|uniref:YciI family protein n=1 Tax=Kovacikia minuta TaxID=2931930 RepID=UPI001CCE520C|nr:YciI family protein [Kovacikia minuta]UBF28824.1 YciI family protein [Kovacikia minuta CCNUW1]